MHPYFKLEVSKQEVESVIQHFLPYMDMLCDTNITSAEHSPDQLMKERIIKAEYENLSGRFTTWENDTSVRFEMYFDVALCLVFLMLLKKLPINRSQAWLIDLRDRFIGEIEKDLQQRDVEYE